MRIRTDARRQAIIDRAGAVFREQGFAGATMSQIAARCGGSKATLYGYFACKQELFNAVMADATESQAAALMTIFDHVEDCPRATLEAFGHAYLDLILSPEIVATTRIAMAEGHCPEIGQMMYDQGPGRGLTMIAEHLRGWIDQGRLRDCDAKTAALHLRALLDAGIVEPTLFGARPEMQRAQAVAAAVDAFLRIYSPEAVSD